MQASAMTFAAMKVLSTPLEETRHMLPKTVITATTYSRRVAAREGLPTRCVRTTLKMNKAKMAIPPPSTNNKPLSISIIFIPQAGAAQTESRRPWPYKNVHSCCETVIGAVITLGLILFSRHFNPVSIEPLTVSPLATEI